jgi:hypothetical protein
MITGDFDLSGIGTVTHIEGNRVYGWGHPFFGMGACEFPLMTGYIHTVYPRQTVSMKMGSPLRTVGVINADVSTGIAGWLGRRPDLIPVRISVCCAPGENPTTFNLQVIRQRALVSSLVQMALVNSVDMQGDLPEELTADLQACIDVEGYSPIILKNTYSGAVFSGTRGPQSLYGQVASLLSYLMYNPYKPVRINSITCETKFRPGRRTAEIDAIELDSESYSPGETLKATVYLRPYKQARQRLRLALALPGDLAEGTYSATVCDDLANVRCELRDNPSLGNPQNLDQLMKSVELQAAAKRTNLVVRVPINAVGVAMNGKSLPDLPPSMVQILGQSRRSGAQAITGALVSRQETSWVVQGSESARFSVTKNKKLLEVP